MGGRDLLEKTFPPGQTSEEPVPSVIRHRLALETFDEHLFHFKYDSATSSLGVCRFTDVSNITTKCKLSNKSVSYGFLVTFCVHILRKVTKTLTVINSPAIMMQKKTDFRSLICFRPFVAREKNIHQV